MTKRREGQKTNWWNTLQIKFEKRGNGYVNFKIGNMEYIMKYSSFLKVTKQLKEDYKLWKERKNE